MQQKLVRVNKKLGDKVIPCDVTQNLFSQLSLKQRGNRIIAAKPELSYQKIGFHGKEQQLGLRLYLKIFQ